MKLLLESVKSVVVGSVVGQQRSASGRNEMAWLNSGDRRIFETGWPLRRNTDGFCKIGQHFHGCGIVVSFYFLAQAVKINPVGTGSAVWIGVAGTAILGIILFSESAALTRLVCILFYSRRHCEFETDNP